MNGRIKINNQVIFDPEKKRISFNGISVAISISATFCLELLIIKKGDIVSHSELYEYAWRRFGMEPTSTSLYQNISNLRKAFKTVGLNDNILQTMPRRGFLLSSLVNISEEDDTSKINDARDNDDDVVVNDGNESTDIHYDDDVINNDMDVDLIDEMIKKSQRKMKALSIALFISISGLIACLVNTFISKNDEIALVCDATADGIKNKLNDTSLKENSSQILKALKQFDINCNTDDIVYIASHSGSDKVSIFSCAKHKHE